MPASPGMVPASYVTYFTATSAAAGVLIGLLFVAISLRDETIFGSAATPGSEALAIITFTALVNAFFVSLLSLIPGESLGISASIMAVVSLASAARLQRRLSGPAGRAVVTVVTYASYSTQLGMGLALIADPHNQGLVAGVAYLLFASMAVALQRAWTLIRGGQPASQTADAQADQRGSSAPT